jgi:hypothetical protein
MPGSLFLDQLGAPISNLQIAFSLDHRIPESMARMIQRQGGQVTAIRGDNVLHLMPFEPGTVVMEKVSSPVYSHNFVYDTVREGRRLDLEVYKLKVKESRKSYTSEEELQIHEYVKANNTPRKSAPGYWENAQKALKCPHSPESMRYHYIRHLSKIDIDKRRKQSPKDYFGPDYEPDYQPSHPHSPHKRVIAFTHSTSHKAIKHTSSEAPLPAIMEEQPTDPLSSSLSELVLSASKLRVTICYGKRIVTKMPEDSLSDIEIMRIFGRLAYICRQLAEIEVSMREVLRTLVHFKGDVQATVQFYAPLPV